jgi:hypothetical protein
VRIEAEQLEAEASDRPVDCAFDMTKAEKKRGFEGEMGFSRLYISTSTCRM